MTTAERSLFLRRTTLSLALAALCAPGLGFAQQATAIAGTSDDPAHAKRGTGAITGRVTMLSGGNAASGVRLELEGTRFSTRTDASDHFRLEGVPPGAYTLIATHERYGETRQSVAVTAGGATVADLVMAPRTSATELDKVVVHGMSGATTLRSVSSPISVITAEEIERKQALNLTDLLRGQFPGMTLSTSGQNDWSTLVNARGDTSWNNTWSETNGDYMKILIDDVEIVRPTLLSLIDPRSIERIEIVRGPLAGAMYGAEGSSGVMRITTKKGRAEQAPEFTAQLAAGVIESDYKAQGVTPMVMDKSLQVIGGSESISYRLGVSEVDRRGWVPAYDSTTRLFSGAVQATRGPFDVSVSAIHSDRDMVLSIYPRCVGEPMGGECVGTMHYPMSETLFATTVGYEASPNWHHTLTMGVDQNRFAYEGTSFGDLRAKSSDYQRRTFRYFTNYDTQLSENFSGRFTLGADLVLYDWQEAEGGHDHGEDDDSGHSHNVIEGWRNLGYYGVAEFGFRDRLYLTVAARLEQDLRKVSDRHSRPFQPRAGVSYVFGGDGNTTVKLRAQWGSSARAPTGEPLVAAGNVLPATNLRPEEKVGWDAGVDIVWASLGSVSITRFDEEGRDLVMPVILNPGSRPQRLQYQNAGLVSNKGWELEARLVLGPVGLRANATMADNQIEALSNYYPPGPYADHVVGARRINVPKHAGGVSATVNAFLGTVSLDANWIGPTRRPFQPVGYVAPSWWRMNLRTEQQINDRLTLFARIDNVLNKQDSETYAFQVAQGRTTVIGLRYTF